MQVSAITSLVAASVLKAAEDNNDEVLQRALSKMDLPNAGCEVLERARTVLPPEDFLKTCRLAWAFHSEL